MKNLTASPVAPAGDDQEQLRRLLTEERYAEAVDLCVTGTSASAISFDASLLHGIALAGVGRCDEACEQFEYAAARATNDAEQALAWLESGFARNRQGRTGDAQALLVRVIAEVHRSNHTSLMPRCALLTGLIAAREGRHAEAITQLRQTIDMAQAHGDLRVAAAAHAAAASACRVINRLDEAETHALAGLHLAEPLAAQFRIAVCCYELAALHYQRGQLERCDTWLAHSERHTLACGSPLLKGDVFSLQAILQSVRGHIGKAIQLHVLASAEYAQAGFLEGAALALFNEAELRLRLGEYEQAISNLEQALAITRQHGGDRTGRYCELALGTIFGKLGNAARARDFLTNVWERFVAAGDWVYAATTALELVRSQQADWSSDLVQRSISRLLRAEGTVHTAYAQLQCAQLCLEMGDVELARPLISAARTTYAADSMPEFLAECDLLGIECEARATPVDHARLHTWRAELQKLLVPLDAMPEWQARVYWLRADLARQLGMPREQGADLAQARAALRRVRFGANDPVLSSDLARLFGQIYAAGSSLAVELNAPDAYTACTADRRSTWIERWQQAVALRRPEVDMRDGVNESSVEHPAITPLTIDHVRQALSIRYGDSWTLVCIEPVQHQTWLQMVLTPQRVTIRQLNAGPLESTWLRLACSATGNHHDVVYAPGNPIPARLAAWLGVDSWIAGASAPTHTVVIADTGPFSRLSFAALPVHGKSLGAMARLSFAPIWTRAALLPPPVSARRPSSRPSLVVAPGTFAEQPGLRHTLRESADVAARLPFSRLLTGPDGTAERFLTEVEQAQWSVVYLATHVLFDRDKPRLSGVAMSDRHLSVQELLSRRIHADLACISGCNGALAWSSGGEERLGVETALLASGVEQVLSCLWRIRDVDAGDMCARMMAMYTESGDIAAALQALILEMGPAQAALWGGWRVTEALTLPQ